MEIASDLDQNEVNLLGLLRESDSEGYSLIRRSGLDRSQLETALKTLCEKGWINVKGNLTKDELDSAYFWVRPEKRGYADYVTGRFSPMA